MTDYGKVCGASRPQEIEITATSVFIASNIEEYTEEIDGETISGFKYDYVGYTKDEYLSTVAIANANAIKELADELAAAKILLGVE